MFYKLQALRGIAACILVFYKSPFSVFNEKTNFMISSYLFVDLFFILSGFVLSHAYAKAIEDGISFKGFMLLRWVRVYPLHFFVLLLFIVYEGLRLTVLGGSPEAERSLFAVLTNVLLIQSLGVHDTLTWNTPSWSISVEFYCYIAFFVLLKTLDNRYRLWSPAIGAAVCYGFLVAIGKDNLNITYDWGIVRCLGGFYLGVFIYRFSQAKPALLKTCDIVPLELLTALSVILAVSFAHLGWFFELSAIASFGLSVYVFSASKSGPVGSIFLTKPLQYLGEWSYSIYMIHLLVWTVVTAGLLTVMQLSVDEITGLFALAVALGVFAVSVVASVITYRYVENWPRQWVKRKFFGQSKPRPTFAKPHHPAS
ncbi:MAG TPA: acyltransferase [Marinagarivorans sp.]